MRPRLLLIVLLALVCSLTRAQVAPDGFYYERYITLMHVHDDNSYTVREIMQPYFLEPSHGLYRSIPTSIWIKRDTTEAQDFSGSQMHHYPVDVTVDWCNLDYLTEEVDGVKDIRIGSADRYLSGEQSITLDYTLQLPDDRTPQSDLFFHSVIGTGNPCTIRRIGFRIFFDTPLPPESLQRIIVYKGPEGSTDDYSRQVLTECTPDSITGWIDELAPYEGVSVFIPLPEGYFDAPQPPYGFWAKVLAVLSCLVLTVVLLREFASSDSVTRVVTFYPPEEISSADVGTLYDCSADDEDLISLLPWFANFGYLRIFQADDGRLMLQRLKDLPDDAPLHQRLIFEALFPAGAELFDTTAQTSVQFGRTWLKARDQILKDNSPHFDQFNYKTFFWLLLGLLLGAMAFAYADTTPDASFMGAFVFVCFAVEAIVIALFCGGFYRKQKGCMLTLSGLFVVLFAASWPYFLRADDFYIPKLYLEAILILSFVASLFTRRLYSMTAFRRERMGQILGLEEFIRTADVDRLKALLTADGRYFYKVLPYAIVFGLADRWAAQFAQLTIPPSDAFTASADNIQRLAHFTDNNNIRHGIEAEKQRQAKAAEQARAHAARTRASSGSSYHSSHTHSSGGRGYSGGGSGGGGSRRW